MHITYSMNVCNYNIVFVIRCKDCFDSPKVNAFGEVVY